jgi:septal ring factor EnvC (AmiA/AmiB activator)
LAAPFSRPAAAQAPAPASKEDAERKLEQKRQELNAVQSKEKSLQDDVAGLDAERERINAQLLDTAALIQRSEGQLTSIEGRLAELEAHRAGIAATASRTDCQASRRPPAHGAQSPAGAHHPA